MVVCKFFLQGTCKFGSSCKFDHQMPSGDAGSSVSILRQNSSLAQTTNNPADVNTLIRSVQSDMENIEKGHQWLLSSYTPFKEKALFPGFEDKSFEEVRYGFYEAGINGTLEQYKQQLQQCFQEAMMKVVALRDPSPDIVALLKQIYNGPVNSVFSSNNVFTGQNNTASIFGGQKATGNSPFGGAPVFAGGTGNTIFGGNYSAAPFASTNSTFNTPAGNNPIFSGQSNSPFAPQPVSNSPFVQQPATNSPFAQPAVTNNTPFAQPAPINNTPFAQPAATNNTPFAQPAATNNTPFAQPAATNNTPFAQPAASNNTPFAQPAASNNTPFTAQAGSIFGGQANFSQPFQGNSLFKDAKPAPPPAFSNSPFNAQSAPFQAAPFQSNSPFNQAAVPFQSAQTNSPFNQNFNRQQFPPGGQLNIPQPNSIFGGNAFNNKPVCNEALYSKGEELTPEEISAFRADSFEFGKIPVKPPPIELCF